MDGRTHSIDVKILIEHPSQILWIEYGILAHNQVTILVVHTLTGSWIFVFVSAQVSSKLATPARLSSVTPRCLWCSVGRLIEAMSGVSPSWWGKDNTG